MRTKLKEVQETLILKGMMVDVRIPEVRVKNPTLGGQKLEAWSFRMKISPGDITRAVGRSPQAWANWVAGWNAPSRVTRTRLEAVTEGEVTEADWKVFLGEPSVPQPVERLGRSEVVLPVGPLPRWRTTWPVRDPWSV